MALDSAGYNTANAFSANDAFATGLQKAAVYDPTQQSSALQTSAAGTLNSQNKTQQDAPSDTQNLQGTPTAGLLSTQTNNMAYPTWAGLGAQSRLATTTSLTPAGTATAQVANPGYQLGGYDPTSGQTAGTRINPSTGQIIDANGQANTLPTQVQAQTPVTTPYNPNLVAPNAQRVPNSIGIGSSSVGGAEIVSVRTSDGQFAYYKFNPQTRTYGYMATYDKNGQVTSGGQKYYDAQGVARTTDPLTAQERGQAQLRQLGAGQTFNGGDANRYADLVTQNENAYIGKWDKANADAAQAANNTANASASAELLKYMQANNGALPPQQAGTSGAYQYSDAAVAAARDQYTQWTQQRAQEDANAAILGSYANKPIDTAAVDAASQLANDAQVSIGASISGGADSGAGSRLGATNSANIIGQGALNHSTAAAQSYYTNMKAFGDALQAQASTDANATETKLNADVQNVSDVAQALEQQLSTLDASVQIRVKGQLQNLNNLVQQYQYAMTHYRNQTGLIHSIAIAILAAGGAIATVATGGLAGVGIAAATAAASAAASAKG